MAEEKTDKSNSDSVLSRPEDLVPKMASSIGVAKTVDNNYILSFITALPKEQRVLVGRYIIERTTADELIDVLTKIKGETENE